MEQGRINDEETLKLRQELRSAKEANQALEERLQELNKDIEDKDMILQDLQESRQDTANVTKAENTKGANIE